MNWRYFVGSNIALAKHTLLSSSMFPLTRYVPRGDSWLYDTQRLANTRKFRVVFDIGANVGQTAWGLVRYYKTARIYCFEPVISEFNILEKRYGKYPNIHCIQKALGRSKGKAIIQLHKNSELNTLAPDQPRTQDLTGETEEIILDTVDAFCFENSIKQIDVLKIDVQGWELEVLKGAQKIISENRIHFIYSEVGFRRSDADMQYFGSFNDYINTPDRFSEFGEAVKSESRGEGVI